MAALSARRGRGAFGEKSLATESVEGRGNGWGRDEDRQWARETALRTIHLLRGPVDFIWPVTLITVDDDVGGPFPAPDRHVFLDTLRALGVEVLADGSAVTDAESVLVAVYADVRGWKGRAGLSERARRELQEAISGPGPTLVTLFSHPWNVVEIPAPIPVLCAWGGEPLMQEAAARAVARLASA
jgi:hypothetical protein